MQSLLWSLTLGRFLVKLSPHTLLINAMSYSTLVYYLSAIQHLSVGSSIFFFSLLILITQFGFMYVNIFLKLKSDFVLKSLLFTNKNLKQFFIVNVQLNYALSLLFFAIHLLFLRNYYQLTILDFCLYCFFHTSLFLGLGGLFSLILILPLTTDSLKRLFFVVLQVGFFPLMMLIGWTFGRHIRKKTQAPLIIFDYFVPSYYQTTTVAFLVSAIGLVIGLLCFKLTLNKLKATQVITSETTTNTKDAPTFLPQSWLKNYPYLNLISFFIKRYFQQWIVLLISFLTTTIYLYFSGYNNLNLLATSNKPIETTDLMVMLSKTISFIVVLYVLNFTLIPMKNLTYLSYQYGVNIKAKVIIVSARLIASFVSALIPLLCATIVGFYFIYQLPLSLLTMLGFFLNVAVVLGIMIIICSPLLLLTIENHGLYSMVFIMVVVAIPSLAYSYLFPNNPAFLIFSPLDFATYFLSIGYFGGITLVIALQWIAFMLLGVITFYGYSQKALAQTPPPIED